MACPTCDHTMHEMGSRVFWCSRCGTLKILERIVEPMLVERCRKFASDTFATTDEFSTRDIRDSWIRYGIAESIGRNE